MSDALFIWIYEIKSHMEGKSFLGERNITKGLIPKFG